MSFEHKRGRLHAEAVEVDALAELFGSPLYVYSAAALRASYAALAGAFPASTRILYSLKANSNWHVAAVLRECGAGAELASIGELGLAQRAGVTPSHMVFAGPAKRDHELRAWMLADGGLLNLESLHEAQRASRIATELGRTVDVALRVNPRERNVDAKMAMGGKPLPFGIDEDQLPQVASAVDALPGLKLRGIHVYSGSQVLDAAAAASTMSTAIDFVDLYREVVGRPCEVIDVGLGLGVPTFPDEAALDLDALRTHMTRVLARLPASCQLHIEAGRFLVASAGIYVSTVVDVKESHGSRFVVTDGGMHHHSAAAGGFGNVFRRQYRVVPTVDAAPDARPSIVVGPLCTPMDRFGSYALPLLEPGARIATLVSGAYGYSCGHLLFLSHATPAEVLVDGSDVRLIREPATTAGLFTPAS
ncbi:MAG: type III PLP-dependent enzyme [Polyangia bacterium]